MLSWVSPFKFVWGGLRRISLCRLFALDNLADVSKNRGRTLLGYPPGNILPYIEPNVRFHLLVKVMKGLPLRARSLRR